MEVKREQFLESAFVRHWAGLYRYVKRTLPGAGGDAADIAQSAFSKLAELPEPDKIQNTKAFLYKTAHNLAIDGLRHAQVQHKHTVEVLRSQTLTGSPEYNGQTDSEDIVLKRERLAMLMKIIEKMPGKRKRIFVLNRVHGLSYDEIAKREGMKKTAVTRHIFRALEDCRREMDEIFEQEMLRPVPIRTAANDGEER